QQVQQIFVRGASDFFHHRHTAAALAFRVQPAQLRILLEGDHPGDIPTVTGTAVDLDGIQSVSSGPGQYLRPDEGEALQQHRPLIPGSAHEMAYRSGPAAYRKTRRTAQRDSSRQPALRGDPSREFG